MRLCTSAITALAIAFLGSVGFAQQADAPRVEVGPQLTQTYLPVNPVGSVQYQPAFGIVAAVKLHLTSPQPEFYRGFRSPAFDS